MKKIFLSLFASLIFTSAFCQNMTSKQAKELKGRILLIALDEVSPEAIGDIKEGIDMKAYEELVSANNTVLKYAFEKYWTFSKELQFVSQAEMTKKLKDEPQKYAAIILARYIDYSRWGGSQMIGYNQEHVGNVTYNVPHYAFSPVEYVAENEIMELRIMMPKRVFSIGLPRIVITEADAIYGVKQLQYYMQELDKEEKADAWKIIKTCRGEVLKGKTLLMSKEDMDPKLTDEEIKKVYTYPYKIVSQDEIDKALIEGTDCAIAVIVSAEAGKGNVSLQYLVNAGSGELYGIIYPKLPVGIKGVKAWTYNQRIKKKQLKDFQEKADCK